MPRRPSILVEAAVDTLELALAAEADGVSRIELCGPLHDGGTTPAADLIVRSLSQLRIPVHVLVRPRAGDFVYSTPEIAQMRRDIEAIRLAGAAGVVTGALTADGAVDTAAMAELAAAARPMKVGFHRAFDSASDQFAALEALISLRTDLVLTTGGAPTAVEGMDRLKSLVERAGKRIGIIAAGSITQLNVRDVVARTGVRQVHGRAFHGVAAAIRPTRPIRPI